MGTRSKACIMEAGVPAPRMGRGCCLLQGILSILPHMSFPSAGPSPFLPDAELPWTVPPRETGLENLRQALSTCLRWPGGLCHLQGSCLGGREAVSMPFESASQTAKLRETSASGRAPGAGPGVRIQVQAVHWGGGPGRHCGLWGVRLGTCPHGWPGLRPHGNPEGYGAPCISMTPKGRGTWLRAAQHLCPWLRIRPLCPHHRLRAMCGRQQGSWMFVPGSSSGASCTVAHLSPDPFSLFQVWVLWVEGGWCRVPPEQVGVGIWKS